MMRTIKDREDFAELVFLFGAEGTNAFAGLDLTDKQRRMVAAAYYSAMDLEKIFGDETADEYCEEAERAARAWYDDFDKEGATNDKN